MRSSNRVWVCLVIVILTIVCHESLALPPLCTRLSSDSGILERLRAGGLVIVLRHTKDVTHRTKRKCVDPSRVLGGPLTCGYKQAEDIRAALEQIPISKVYYSPACRTIDTAKHIFGELDPANKKSKLKIGAAPRWLLGRLATVPEEGKNEVLVTHSEVLSSIRYEGRQLINGHSSYGLAAIFDPTKASSEDWLLGCLEPDQWLGLEKGNDVLIPGATSSSTSQEKIPPVDCDESASSR